MTSGAVKWLPISDAAANAVKARVDQAVRDWSSAWFSRPFPLLSTLGSDRDDVLKLDGGAGWRSYGQGLKINAPKRASQRLLDRALDVRLNQLVLTDLDHQLLDAFEQTLMGDLVSRIETALDLENENQNTSHSCVTSAQAPSNDRGVLVITIAEEYGTSLFSITIPRKTILPFSLALLPPARPSSERLEPLSKALGAATVTIEANLGRAELRLSELKDLTPGDVLVLDAGLEDPAEISMPGGDHVIARAKLGEVAGQVTLIFQPRS